VPSAVDLHEDFIDVEGIAIASVFPFQSSSVKGTELDTPESDRLAADSDASFSEKIFYIPVTEIESKVEPDGIGNDVWWKSVAFVGIHPPILAMSASLFGNTR
jgi:hypothetical protein